jgi:hypothetical protein
MAKAKKFSIDIPIKNRGTKNNARFFRGKIGEEGEKRRIWN